MENMTIFEAKIEAIKGFVQMIEQESDPFLKAVQAQALWDLSTEIKQMADADYRGFQARQKDDQIIYEGRG